MAETLPGALLDLDTFVVRPFITVDGERVEILNPDELSVIESHRFGLWGKRIEELSGQTGKQAEDELEELVATVARKICVGITDDQFVRLSGTNRWAIIDLFTALRLRSTLKVAGAMTAATGPIPENLAGSTGASSSPGLFASTAAPPSTGFTARLRGWFGLL